MPSFDISCEADLQEVDNATNSTIREITARYDFKGSNTSIERKDRLITINTEDDMRLKAIAEMLKSNFVRRKLDAKFLNFKVAEKASGNTLRQEVEIRNGIEKDVSKKIVKQIKDSKIKVQASINGDEIRVTGKKIDDLQEVISVLKSSDYDIPLEFGNFRN